MFFSKSQKLLSMFCLIKLLDLEDSLASRITNEKNLERACFTNFKSSSLIYFQFKSNK